MSVKYTDFTGNIISQTRIKSNIFLRTLCDRVVQISEPKTPRRLGNLRRDVLRQVLGLRGVIDWRKKYAQYQERGMRADGTRRVRKYTTSGTGPHFAENAIRQAVQESESIIARIFK